MHSSSSSVRTKSPFNCTTWLTTAVVNILLHIYAVHAWPEASEEDDSPEGRGKYTNVNGSNYMNGHTRTPSETQRVQDAEAFELQGLVSDEEEAGESSMGPRRHEDEEMGKEASHS